MQTTVSLQEPFGYSIFLLVIMATLLIGLTWYTIYLKKKKLKLTLNEIDVKPIPEKNIKEISVIKDKYLKKLEDIEYKYNNKKIELRQAYQSISEIVRLFVFEITDITTQNYSLSEIKKLNIPILYELIKEYYEPEFACKSTGDLMASISKARRVINEWK